MGTWDTGPFDNDAAADFADDVDDTADDSARQIALIRTALEAAAGSGEFLDLDAAAAAVAAAALVAARLAGAEPYHSAVYGPKVAPPAAPAELIPLAVRALDRVMGPSSELARLWNEDGVASGNEDKSWRAVTGSLRTLLAKAAPAAMTAATSSASTSTSTSTSTTTTERTA